MQLSVLNDENPRLHFDEQKIVYAIAHSGTVFARISTNQITPVRDRKDFSSILGLKFLNITIKKDADTVYVLRANISVLFNQRPWCAGIFIVGVREQKRKYSEVSGVPSTLNIVSSASEAGTFEDTKAAIQELLQSNELVYNIDQFSEFMDVFGYYKQLSAAINNDYSYKIDRISDPYWFLPITAPEFDGEFGEEVYDANRILIGYRIDEAEYEQLRSSTRKAARLLIDVIFESEMDLSRAIKSRGEHLYLSQNKMVDETNIRALRPFELVNCEFRDHRMILSGENSTNGEGALYLNAYDMGQKIKLESIDNSLRLINEGSGGAAAELLQYLIGDTPVPNRAKPLQHDYAPYVGRLNQSQLEAFLKAVDGSPVTVIKGPPGTGKTHVINAITQYLTKECGEKVVISSQTHVAIDNVLDHLMENSDPIIPKRITNGRNKYSTEEIDFTLYDTWAKNYRDYQSSQARLADEVRKDLLNFRGEERVAFAENCQTEYPVIGATTTTSAIAGKKGLEVLKGCRWLIIDEVSKCPLPEVLRYLPYVERIILVGDDFQLAPLFEISEEEAKLHPDVYDPDKFEKLRLMYESSVFAKTLEKARKSGRLVILNENYRSTAQVLACYNVFYDNTLIGRREQTNPTKVTFDSGKNSWNECDAFFVDVKYGKEETIAASTSRRNVQEAQAIADYLNQLLIHTLDAKRVTVAAIFPYGDQISYFCRKYRDLINKARKTFKSFDLDTVDAFQGKQAQIVLLSTVVTDSSRRNFLNDFRRINVSMSRAEDKLFIFGNPITLSQIEMSVGNGAKRKYFKEIIERIKFDFGGNLEYKGKED